MGLTGNLSAGEIVEQLAYASQLTRIRNIVFMGMGEPLNNYKAVKVCLDTLGHCLHPSPVWLSAVAVWPEPTRALDRSRAQQLPTTTGRTRYLA